MCNPFNGNNADALLIVISDKNYNFDNEQLVKRNNAVDT